VDNFIKVFLAQHLNPDNSIYRDWLQQIASAFMHAGYTAMEATDRRYISFGGVILLFGEHYWGKPRQDESGSPRRSIQQGV
jgi:hypothetical protein